MLAACGGGSAPPEFETGAGEQEPEMPAPAAEEPFDESMVTSAPAMPVNTPKPSFPETAPTSTLASQPLGAAPALPSFSPILFRNSASPQDNFQLLGAFSEGVWMKDEDALTVMQFEQIVDVYDTNGFHGTTLIHDSTSSNPSFCGLTYIASDPTENSGWQFGFYQGWEVTHRPWTDISTDSSFYNQAVTDWLVSQGISNPNVQISRVMRVDIEGDGMDEVFISASYFKGGDPVSPVTEFGDYSLVLMRKLSGNDVIAVPIEADVYHSSQPELTYPWVYTLSGFLDLNQDGNLEVILEAVRWEGTGILVFEVKDRNIIQALNEVCAE